MVGHTAPAPAFQGDGEKSAADRPTANRYQHFVGAGFVVRYSGRDGSPYITGVDQAVGDLECLRETCFQGHESRITVDEHEIEISAHPFDDLATSISVLRRDNDIPER